MPIYGVLLTLLFLSPELKDDEEREVRIFLLNDCVMSAVPTKSAWMSESYKVCWNNLMFVIETIL